MERNQDKVVSRNGLTKQSSAYYQLEKKNNNTAFTK